MKITIAKNGGFCPGVEAAVRIAEKYAGSGAYCLGEIIHNETVVERLESLGLKTVDSLEGIESGCVIIRSHGVGKAVYEQAEKKGLTIIDATCPFVKKIHNLVSEHDSRGERVVIIGKRNHPEVIGVQGWCDGKTTVVESVEEVEKLLREIGEDEKVCFVAQTTFSRKKYEEIMKKISNSGLKTVEIFDTICYTTTQRQSEALRLASENDKVLVIGSRNSSNTTKLYEICKSIRSETYLAENASELRNIVFDSRDDVAVVAGASTPKELILEVKRYMSDKFESKDFESALNETFVEYREGKRVTGTVLFAKEDGIAVNIGGKKDGFIDKEEVCADGKYNPADYPSGTEIEAIILKKNEESVLLSKKKADKIKEGDKMVDSIRDGRVFELESFKIIKGGLLGRLGTYSVFVPSSQVTERKHLRDLRPFENMKLRLIAIEIDDDKREVVASRKKVLDMERKEQEDVFWENVRPDVVVNGVVKRYAPFGVFVGVGGVDCLVHLSNISWNRGAKAPDKILKIGESYDFLVLTADREKGQVALGYKQLQPEPIVVAKEKYPVGTVVNAKVVSIRPFGVFMELEPEIEGLVHVSELAHNYVPNPSEIVKVGERVDVKVVAIDEPRQRISLSLKACIEPPPPAEHAERPAKSERREKNEKFERGEKHEKHEKREKGEKAEKPENLEKKEKPSTPADVSRAEPQKEHRPPRKPRPERDAEETSEYSEESVNNPFAELLKDFDVK